MIETVLAVDPVTLEVLADRLDVEPVMIERLFVSDATFPTPCWLNAGWPRWDWFAVQRWARNGPRSHLKVRRSAP